MKRTSTAMVNDIIEKGTWFEKIESPKTMINRLRIISELHELKRDRKVLFGMRWHDNELLKQQLDIIVTKIAELECELERA